jgi:hypothetical protein
MSKEKQTQSEIVFNITDDMENKPERQVVTETLHKR